VDASVGVVDVGEVAGLSFTVREAPHSACPAVVVIRGGLLLVLRLWASGSPPSMVDGPEDKDSGEVDRGVGGTEGCC
jgi:hypothetical protein